MNCNICSGDGVTYHWLANHSKKLLYLDWMYFTSCHPDSSGTYPLGFDEISVEDVDVLLSKGYCLLEEM